jgi:gpW
MSSELDGIDPTTLQTWLTAAQNALQSITIGGQAVTLQYGIGDSHRQVTYARTNLGNLRQWIAELQQALGLRRHARRGMGVSFR